MFAAMAHNTWACASGTAKTRANKHHLGDAVVSALATAQRNVAAAVVVTFSLGGDVAVLTMVGALVIPIVLIILAGELGRRTAEPAATD